MVPPRVSEEGGQHGLSTGGSLESQLKEVGCARASALLTSCAGNRYSCPEHCRHVLLGWEAPIPFPSAEAAGKHILGRGLAGVCGACPKPLWLGWWISKATLKALGEAVKA